MVNVKFVKDGNVVAEYINAFGYQVMQSAVAIMVNDLDSVVITNSAYDHVYFTNAPEVFEEVDEEAKGQVLSLVRKEETKE